MPHPRRFGGRSPARRGTAVNSAIEDECIVKIQHVILTRFNLATPGREKAIRNQPGWLSERFELFERYCLPSVAAQTHKDFHWIVFFDEKTPDQFKERIDQLRGSCGFYPYYTKLFPADGWANAIREVLGPQPQGTHLLTTRLDNDDGLALDFTQRLHENVVSVHAGDIPLVFNFTQGFILNRARLYRLRHKSNAFASLLEPFDENMRTITTIPHMDLGNEYEIRQIEGPGAWLQVVHETNVSNKIRGFRVSSNEAKQRFPSAIGDEFEDASAAIALLENTTISLVRGARDRFLDLRRGLVGKNPT